MHFCRFHEHLILKREVPRSNFMRHIIQGWLYYNTNECFAQYYRENQHTYVSQKMFFWTGEYLNCCLTA